MGVLFGERAPVIYAFGEVRELGRRDLRGPRVARSDMCSVVRRATEHTVAHLLIHVPGRETAGLVHAKALLLGILLLGMLRALKHHGDHAVGANRADVSVPIRALISAPLH